MALPPEDNRRAEEEARQQKLRDEMLMREVDDAVRQDQMVDVWRKYGRPALVLVVVGLAALGGYLWWHSRQEAALELRSEQLITAIDQLQAGNTSSADSTLAALDSDGSVGARAVTQLLRAGIAAENGKTDEAIAAYDEAAGNAEFPQTYRDLANIRSIALQFDDIEPSKVIETLKPIAVPGNPWFGSAGELVAMAYLDNDQKDLAGPLFAEIAKDEDVPESLRSRTRQMAGLLGYDAVVDVDEIISDLSEPAPAAGPSGE